MIKENDIIRIKSAPKPLNRTTGAGKNITRRVLYVQQGRKIVAMIDPSPSNKNAKVELYDLDDILLALQTDRAKIEQRTSQFFKVTAAENAYQAKAWEALKPFRDSGSFDYLFDCHLRAELVTAAAKAGNCSAIYIRTALRRYLQGGCTQVGIRSHLANCGKNPEQMMTTRQGRPDLLKEFQVKLTGCAITAEIAQKFAAGIHRHLMGTGNMKISIPEAYRRILYDEFRIEVQTPEGKKWVLGDRLPTLAQFRAFLHKNFAGDKPPQPDHEARNGKPSARD